MIGAISGSGSYLYSQMSQMTTETESFFDKLDVNGDGSLDQDELGAVAEATGGSKTAEDLIAELDTDADGLLSEAEFEASPPPGPPPGIMGMSGENEESASTSLDPLDTNGDGIVDADEAAAGMNMMLQSYSDMSSMGATEGENQSLVNLSV